MLPVWRYWVAMMLCPVVVGIVIRLGESPWRFLVFFVYGVLFAMLLLKYTKKLVEVER